MRVLCGVVLVVGMLCGIYASQYAIAVSTIYCCCCKLFMLMWTMHILVCCIILITVFASACVIVYSCGVICAAHD